MFDWHKRKKMITKVIIIIAIKSMKYEGEKNLIFN